MRFDGVGRLQQKAAEEVDIQLGEELDMQTYIVYRLDYNRLVSEPVGQLVERRSKERVNNTKDLLEWAKRIFPPFPSDSSLVITPE
jgi:hypothetical protein